MRALVENYFCIAQPGISSITGVLSLTTAESTAEGFEEGEGTKQKKSPAFQW